uniref:X8 domain-containing protein n=1 Tax=Kalanchoe fedtschenkoi TaxID=63787 RepID=A0A7N0TB46_KALFE
MAALLAFLALMLAMAAHSDAALYCLCKDGVGQSALQKTLDYACGAGADCSGILQNGACYNPNTVKNHCDYAVNSYFQRKGQVTGSCDFNGCATTSSTVPTQTSGCIYQSSPGSTTPSTPTNSGFLTPPGIPTGTGFGPNGYSDTSAAVESPTSHSLRLSRIFGCLLLVFQLVQ